MTARKRPRRPWGTPRLDLSSGLRFVFRREVRLSADPGPDLPPAAEAVLLEAGFEPIRTPTPRGGGGREGSTDIETWVGERWLPRRRETASTARIPIVTVLLAAGALGGLDAYISNSLVVIGYWLLGGIVFSLVFWLRYGRVYDTDVAMVSLSRTFGDSTSGPATVSVLFWITRVRSQVLSGTRVPAGVTGPIWLAAEIGDLAREFERRSSGAVPKATVRTESS